MPQFVGRVLRRWELGSALRRLREERGMTIVDVTVAMKERFGSSFSPAKLSRMETAKRGVIPRDVHDLCVLYGVPDEVRDSLLELAKLAREQEKWEEQVAQPGLVRYTALEQIAVRTRIFSTMYVPGLLQTDGYSSVVENLESLAPGFYDWSNYSGDPSSRIDFRRRRQQLLDDPDPLKLHAVLDENVLRRSLPDPTIMKEQVRHLISASEKPNVTIQIMPISQGLYPGSESAYWAILDIPEAAGQVESCVFMEGVLGAAVSEREAETSRLAIAFTVLADLALDPKKSVAFMEDLYLKLGRGRSG